MDERALAVVNKIALMSELSDEIGKIEHQFAGVGLCVGWHTNIFQIRIGDYFLRPSPT